jgi:hypothetical protein
MESLWLIVGLVAVIGVLLLVVALLSAIQVNRRRQEASDGGSVAGDGAAITLFAKTRLLNRKAAARGGTPFPTGSAAATQAMRAATAVAATVVVEGATKGEWRLDALSQSRPLE